MLRDVCVMCARGEYVRVLSVCVCEWMCVCMCVFVRARVDEEVEATNIGCRLGCA